MTEQTQAAESGPISLDRAAALMRDDREGRDSSPAATDPAARPTSGAPETAAQPSSAPQEAQPQPSGEELTPDELGDTESTAGEEAGQPPLDPPASFSADEKAAFKNAPRPVQEALRRLEDSRRSDHSKRTQQVQDLQTKFEASMRAVESERQLIAQQITPLVQQLQAQVQEEFSDIKSVEDLARLAQSDPARYIQLDAKMKALNLAEQHRQAAEHQQRAKAADELRAHLAGERSKLLEKIPAWKDESAYRTGIGEVKAYLKAEGLDDATINGITSHVAVSVARKAMLYDRAIAKRSEARQPGTPTATVRPGAAAPNSRIEREIQAASERLSKTGSFDDGLALMRLPQRRN